MGIGYIRVSHPILCELFTKGFRGNYEITQGLPEGAVLVGACAYPDYVTFYFQHETLGKDIDAEVIVECSRLYEGG